jgi:hypothetical protein
MWIIWEERFEIFDDVFLFAKWFEVAQPKSFAILHKHHGYTGVTDVTEEKYYKFKNFLHEQVMTYRPEQIPDYQRALARPIITPELLEKLRATTRVEVTEVRG